MHMSKTTLYLGIIIYSACLLFFQDWPLENQYIGTISALFLAKMLVDVGFVGAALVRLAGPAFFATDDDDDEVSVHAEDIAFSDTALYGLFFANVLGNAVFHGYETVMTSGAVSTWFAIWVLIEAVVLFFCYVLWAHAAKVQRRKARKAREAKAAQEAMPIRKAS